MPGKPDSHTLSLAGGLGTYYPGSKEYRAWGEGWDRRYIEGDASKANTVHPSGTAEFEADQNGWDQANNNSTGLCRMPALCGVPPTGSP